MRSSILIGGVVVAVVLVWVGFVRAGSDDAALRNAGGLVWEMTEWHREFSVGRLARRMTRDKERALAESAAGKLARQRDKLAVLLPQLPPNSPFTSNLATFVRTWPTRDAFLQDLLGDTHGEASGIAITSLAMQVTDSRRQWKTLFPFFRP